MCNEMNIISQFGSLRDKYNLYIININNNVIADLSVPTQLGSWANIHSYSVYVPFFWFPVLQIFNQKHVYSYL